MMNFTSVEVIHHKKFSIIRTGLAAMACAITISLEGLRGDLGSVVVDESKLQGDTLDLKRARPFMKMPKLFPCYCRLQFRDYHSRCTSGTNLQATTDVQVYFFTHVPQLKPNTCHLQNTWKGVGRKRRIFLCLSFKYWQSKFPFLAGLNFIEVGLELGFPRQGWEQEVAVKKTELSGPNRKHRWEFRSYWERMLMATLGILVWITGFGNLYPCVHFHVFILVSFEHFKHFFSHVSSHTSPTHSQSAVSPTYVVQKKKKKK